MGAVFPKMHKNAHVAFVRIAAKSDWLAAANCLDLAFKRTEMGVSNVSHQAIMKYTYSFDPNLTRPLLRRFWNQGWSR